MSHGTRRTYRKWRNAASAKPGTLREQLSAVAMFLDIQTIDRRHGRQRERRWIVCHALACDRAIPIGEPTL